MKEVSLYLPSSGGTKKGQGQATKLFPGDYCTTEGDSSVFLQHLKGAIQKHTTVDSESQVGEVLFKDKFLTQSAPDIRRKLQKVVAKGERSLGQLVQLGTSVYCNQDLTKERDKDEKHQDLITALREFPTRWGPLPG
jgi:hypothetical protein